jgi:hypothetical protein
MNKPTPSQLLSATSISASRAPKKTFQDKLSYDEIKEKLNNYVKVKNLADVPLYTHLRYIETKIDPTTKKKVQRFRLGGYLINNKNLDKYIVLSNGRIKWSVQVANTVFYKSLLSENPMEDSIAQATIDVEKLKEEVKNLKEILVEQELKIKKLKEKNKELKNKKKT